MLTSLHFVWFAFRVVTLAEHATFFDVVDSQCDLLQRR